ncbi:uncharacterized protein BDZ99DRAFT_387820 [Mytilinidion resinicola]|uniref:Uncharacterized protein n=1 Tax=Mytilinidion resinicola TaxID=574789 RepID=A0A6A6YN48_9PEZI|nr:uncharacterized protein BDZ99DRAFT_387820 [Mytilinidion resinicola]KAF2810210.1 hypothetical protein BDZ99DRAFT_387820 [Mytilinidion resinicola]
MPVHAAEENATGIAKDSSDSTASTHKNHNVDTGVNPGGVHANAHKANPGPVIAENIGKPESKEALKKRAEELNQ